jgi:hypothetical protein
LNVSMVTGTLQPFKKYNKSMYSDLKRYIHDILLEKKLIKENMYGNILFKREVYRYIHV